MDATDFTHHSDYVWLAMGVAFMAAEALGASGIGFMFAGLGALVTGALLHLTILANDAYIIQGCVFFIASAVWAAALWKPLQKFHTRTSAYHNIIGDTAYVGSQGINKKSGGEVTWSGTIMKAQLTRDAVQESLEAGSQVTIVALTGATLVVKPKD